MSSSTTEQQQVNDLRADLCAAACAASAGVHAVLVMPHLHESVPLAADRPLARQADLRDAIKPCHGAAVGNTLTLLPRDHIGIAVLPDMAVRLGAGILRAFPQRFH